MNAQGPFPAVEPVAGHAKPDLRRRNFLIGGALVLTAGVAVARQPKPTPSLLAKDELDRIIPKSIGPWTFETASGLVLPPPDQLSDSLYSDLMTRVYLAPDLPPIMLLIAYSGVQDGMIQVHRPEFCYTAGGYALSPGFAHAIPIKPGFALPTTRLTATLNGRNEELMYWTRMGGAFPLRWIDQRIAVLRENLAGRIPDGLLVRVSTIGPDGPAATAAIDRFTQLLVTSAPRKARQLLLGPANA